MRPAGAETGSRGSTGETRFALAAALAFAAVAGWGTWHHELWRDEAQAWLIARDSASPVEILRNARYEGHPILWFLLLWPIAHVAHSLVGMQVLSVLLGAATAFIVARWAPAPRWARALAVAGYFPLYEYGVIARNYGAGLLLLVAFCALWPRRRSRPVLAGLLLALAANTSLPAAVLAVAAVAATSLDGLSRRSGRAPARTWAGVGVAALGIAVGVAQMLPPSDSGYMVESMLGLDRKALRETVRTVPAALAPLPRIGRDGWGTSVLDHVPGLEWLAVACALALLVAVLASLRRRPAALAMGVVGVGGLLAFFYVKSPGSLRHQGFLVVALGMALWMAEADDLACALPSEGPPGGRLGKAAFSFILSVQVVGSALGLWNERAYVFSGARGTAMLIREKGLAGHTLVVHRDWMSMAVLAYLDKDRACYAAGDRCGSFIVWNRTRFVESSPWAKAMRIALAEGRPVVIVLDAETLVRDPVPEQLRGAVDAVGCRAGELVASESLCVYLLDRERIPRWLEEAAR